MHGYPAKPKDRNKTPGFPAPTQQTVTKHMAFQPPPCNRQSQNTWLSSHHPTDSNKTKGLPATTKNTWLSSHHPTETKHMASSHHFQTFSLFFCSKKSWLKFWENACLEAFGFDQPAKI